jgi:pimeloyl-ACP methyl ester carboxylesterase
VDEPIPFVVDVPNEVLDDLRERLERTRWFDDLADGSWQYGVSGGYLRELCEYWRTGFDWRAQEALVNAFDQFLAVSDGQPIHFIHARSPEPHAIPLLLVHGWPGSVFEYVGVIDRLRDPVRYGGDAADAFHIVCPSIPGYGFSGPTVAAGWGPRRIAAAFAELMDRLGYTRYATGGGDWGAIITTELGRVDQGAHVLGMHLTMPLGDPPVAGDPDDELTDADAAGLADWAAHQAAGTVVHVPINSTRPHTLAFALNDSPAGLAAWLLDKFRSYSDCDGDIERSFSKDQLLAHVTTYWVTGTIASASRLYYERAHARLAASSTRVEIPTGCAIFPKDVRRVPRAWAERLYDVRRWVEMPAGGHFGSEEEPAAYVDEVRTFFRGLR